jgi:hypothetical protein
MKAFEEGPDLLDAGRLASVENAVDLDSVPSHN